jgi:hypothetical protein
LTSNKKCDILYSRKQEPNSSLEGEAERQREQRYISADVTGSRSLDLIKADFAEAMVFDIKRFEFF